MVKFILYLLVIPLVVYSFESVNFNNLFKKNKEREARVFYLLLVFGLSYLVVNFLNEFLNLL